MSSSLLFRRAFQTCSPFRSFNLISTRLTSSSSNDQKATASIDAELKKKIDQFVQSNKVAIFIKGEPNAPR